MSLFTSPTSSAPSLNSAPPERKAPETKSLFGNLPPKPAVESPPLPSLVPSVEDIPDNDIEENLAPAAVPEPAEAPLPVAEVGEPSDSNLVTVKELARALPASLRSSATQALADKLNAISKDEVVAEEIRKNFLGYSRILQEGRFKVDDYLSAVTYVSYKLMDYTNEEAYERTFRDRYNRLVAEGRSRKEISSYVSSYHKGRLVSIVMEQAIMPSWVLNRDMYQKALNVQYDLMTTAASEKVRTEAANSLLVHLAKPKDSDFQINLNTTESTGLKDMQNAIRELAIAQRQSIQNQDMKTVDVASSRLIRGDAEDV